MCHASATKRVDNCAICDMALIVVFLLCESTGGLGFVFAHVLYACVFAHVLYVSVFAHVLCHRKPNQQKRRGACFGDKHPYEYAYDTA